MASLRLCSCFTPLCAIQILGAKKGKESYDFDKEPSH
jgi:hypothetical protein